MLLEEEVTGAVVTAEVDTELAVGEEANMVKDILISNQKATRQRQQEMKHHDSLHLPKSRVVAT